MFPKSVTEIARTVKTVTHIGLLRQDWDPRTTFPNLENLNRLTSETPPETAKISGLTLKFAAQMTPEKTNETEVPLRRAAMKKNTNRVAGPTSSAVSAKHVSIVSKMATSGTNVMSDAKFWAPAYQRGNCSGNSKSLQHTDWLKTVVDDKSVFVRVMVCEVPVDAVCDTGAIVSCLSPKVFNRRFPKTQSYQKPCSKQLLAANHREIKVTGELAVEMKIASIISRHTFLVLKAYEAECFFLDFLETYKCDFMFSETKLRLKWNTSANFCHRTATVQSRN